MDRHLIDGLRPVGERPPATSTRLQLTGAPPASYGVYYSLAMARRIFHGFPTTEEVTERIEDFRQRIRDGRYVGALVLCPLEDFSDSGVNAEKIEERVRQYFGFRSGEIELGLVEEVKVERHHDEASVVVRFSTQSVIRFVLSTDGDDRWSMRVLGYTGPTDVRAAGRNAKS